MAVNKTTPKSTPKTKKTVARAKPKSMVTGKVMKYGLTIKEKEEFVESLISNNFNISKTCTATGVSRMAYYYLLKWDEDFQARLEWSEGFLKNIVSNGIVEGLLHGDLTLRLKYLELLAKAGILAKVLGIKEDTTDFSKIFDGKKITLT